jgi:hypothetical protein
MPMGLHSPIAIPTLDLSSQRSDGPPPRKRTRGRPGCAALGRLAATTRHAEETGRRLPALLRTLSGWSAPGHVSPAAGLMDLRWVVKPDTDRRGCYPSVALPAGGIR